VSRWFEIDSTLSSCPTVSFNSGRTIAPAVSRQLPTAAVRVRVWVRSCGICGGQSVTGAGFLLVFRFPLPILVPPIAPQSPSSIIWGWYNRPVAAAVPSGLSLTTLRIIIKKQFQLFSSDSSSPLAMHVKSHRNSMLLIWTFQFYLMKNTIHILLHNAPHSRVTSQLSSWSWALLEKPPVMRLLKNFPRFYGTRRFITVSIRALQWSLS
jgi:hypothetical protein